ncbi:ABC transporter permease [Trueperella pyogenes]|uniref:ABC transporter permease n=1 Tax=Trueperella pyogenes TaxID=1661 RepID=UPI00345D25D5
MLIHVMKREFMTMARSKAMIISIVVMVVLILGGGLAGRYFLADDPASEAPAAPIVAVEESAREYLPYLEKVASGSGIETTVIATGSAEDYLRDRHDSKAEGYAVVLVKAGDVPNVVVEGDGTRGVKSSIAAMINTAASAQLMDSRGAALTDADYAQLAASVDVAPRFVSFDRGNLILTNPVGYFTSLAGMMVMFMMIMLGISTIANGVVQEKSSRVVEILLTTIRPRTLLLGKVLGIGVFLLLQFTVLIVTALAAVNIAGIDLNLNLGDYLGWMVLWMVLGFFFYAMVMGAFASLATRQEDLSAVTTPVSMAMLVPFYLALFLVPNAPDSTWTKVLSAIPGLSPFMVPVRQAYQAVSTTEMVLAAALGVVAIPLVAMLAGKIYSNSILHTGKRLSIVQAFRAHQ